MSNRIKPEREPLDLIDWILIGLVVVVGCLALCRAFRG